MTKRAPPQLTVAVTGSAGSGKSFVCRRISALGGCVIDADQIARDAVNPGTPGLQKIVARFGPAILTADGLLDRAALRRRIIEDADAREALEAIVHPEIFSMMAHRIQSAHREHPGLVVVEVPLLFELGAQSRFDRVVLVKADRQVKARRIMARDRVSSADAERLLDLQFPDEKKEKGADYVIENDGSLEELIEKIDRVYERLYFKPGNENPLTGR